MGSLTCTHNLGACWTHELTKGGQAQTGLHKSWLGGSEKLSFILSALSEDRTKSLWIRSLMIHHWRWKPLLLHRAFPSKMECGCTWWGHCKRSHMQSSHPVHGLYLYLYIHVLVWVHILGDPQSVQLRNNNNTGILNTRLYSWNPLMWPALRLGKRWSHNGFTARLCVTFFLAFLSGLRQNGRN